MNTVAINGKNIEISADKNLTQLLDIIDIKGDNIIIEMDGEIILKQDFDNTLIGNAKNIEVIKFVGGG